MTRPNSSTTELNALLGRGTKFQGNLLFNGAVRLDGVFRGQIISDGTLVIGDGADIDAEIRVANVIVRGGKVQGTITAQSAIELYVPAHVTASLHSPSVYVEKGVHFDGTCRMVPVEEEAAEPTT